jgi:3',5'-cyclic AMP phosphodiesterase CpdA
MQMKRLLSMTLGLLMSMTQVIAETKITVLSDIHVMAPELIVNNGSAWQNYLAGKRTMLDNSTQLFDELIPQLIADKPDLLLITGDLTKDGEQVSHQLVVKQLDRLRASGIRVLVIPGDHDLGT